MTAVERQRNPCYLYALLMIDDDDDDDAKKLCLYMSVNVCAVGLYIFRLM